MVEDAMTILFFFRRRHDARLWKFALESAQRALIWGRT